MFARRKTIASDSSAHLMSGGLRQRINQWMVRRTFASERETRRRAAEDPEFRTHLERFDADARPVLGALADAGLRVKDLPDLINRDIDYGAQIPLLIEWLPRVEYAPVKATIARALRVREARPAAAPALLDELRRAAPERPPPPPDEWPDSIENSNVRELRFALGMALAFTAEASHFDAIAELIEDTATGSARSVLISDYLGRFRALRERAIPILRRLLSDDDLGRYALKPLARLRATEARPEMERFLRHDQAWVRHDAKRALAKLDHPN
jgi:hypothetical protein